MELHGTYGRICCVFDYDLFQQDYFIIRSKLDHETPLDLRNNISILDDL